MSQSIQARRLAALAAAMIGLTLLACGAPMAFPAVSGPRWACPSPVPQPWGAEGPPKRVWQECTTDPLSGARVCTAHRESYEQWEQEYSEGGTLLGGQAPFDGPPYPSPTPYGRMGNTYTFGQRVEVAPLHVIAMARSGERVSESGQIYLLELIWWNPTGTAIPVTYASQLWLRSVVRADGIQQAGDGWGIDMDTAQRLGMEIPEHMPPGESRVVLPVVAPPGRPAVIELRMPVSAARSAGPDDLTPTPNSALRDTEGRLLTVQWVDSSPVGPSCADPGALTDWSSSDAKAIPRDAMLSLRAPEGAGRIVEIALRQVGKRYVWGAEGPDTFDCSGLVFWSYAQIGVPIPRTTATQWPRMRPVALGAVQPGDLVFMDTRAASDGVPRQATHVGMLADVDGDQRWDLIHAASPRLGVRVEYDVFASAYYAPRLFSEGRTAR